MHLRRKILDAIELDPGLVEDMPIGDIQDQLWKEFGVGNKDGKVELRTVVENTLGEITAASIKDTSDEEISKINVEGIRDSFMDVDSLFGSKKREDIPSKEQAPTLGG